MIDKYIYTQKNKKCQFEYFHAFERFDSILFALRIYRQCQIPPIYIVESHKIMQLLIKQIYIRVHMYIDTRQHTHTHKTARRLA